MSFWYEIKDNNIELSDDGKTIEVLYKSDDFGNYYLELSVEHIKKLLESKL